MKLYFIIVLLFLLFLLRNKSRSEYIVNKDYITPTEDINGSTDYKSIKSSYKSAWTTGSINKNMKHHTSKIENEKTNPGAFFDNTNMFVDTTSSRSTKLVPDECSINNGEILCNYNNRLYNIPPRRNKNNLLIDNIGDDKDINTNNLSNKKVYLGGNTYNIWDIENEKTINGGKYYDDIVGYSKTDGVLELSKYDNKKVKYAL